MMISDKNNTACLLKRIKSVCTTIKSINWLSNNKKTIPENIKANFEFVAKPCCQNFASHFNKEECKIISYIISKLSSCHRTLMLSPEVLLMIEEPLKAVKRKAEMIFGENNLTVDTIYRAARKDFTLFLITHALLYDLDSNDAIFEEINRRVRIWENGYALLYTDVSNNKYFLAELS